MMPDKKAPVTLEDILRLKRAERPNPEFWIRFERELRAKQLAAIVERRPWWNGLSRIFGVVARNHLPIGAITVLALTWVGVRQLDSPLAVRPSLPDLDGARFASARASVPVATAAQESRIVSVDEDAETAPQVVPLSTPVISANTPHIVEMAAAPATPAESISTGATRSAADSMLPVNHSLNIDLAEMQANGSDLSHRFMGMSQGFEVGETSARQPMTDPLARMNPASDERRARLLATALPVATSSIEPSTISNERMVTRLSEDRFYESFSRYSGGGDRFSIKF